MPLFSETTECEGHITHSQTLEKFLLSNKVYNSLGANLEQGVL
jgi:hypothetical protein